MGISGRIIIAGSREGIHPDLIFGTLDRLFGRPAEWITELVSGTARGVDSIGEDWARQRGVRIRQFPAEWDKFGKRAGFLRNQQMAEYADCLVAFWNGQSKGTKHMIDIMKNLGKPVEVILS
jgi:hypothetical protein